MQLIEAGKDRHILSERYARRYEDIVGIYTDIALLVADKIEAVITTDEQKILSGLPAASPAAFKLVASGNELRNRVPENAAQRSEFRSEAEACYRKAAYLDSAFADAYVGLAILKWGSQKIDSANYFADKALYLNNQKIDAYRIKAEYYSYKRNPAKMSKVLGQALRIDPVNIWANHLMGGIYYYRGEFCEAFRYLVKIGRITGTLKDHYTIDDLRSSEWNTLHIFRTLFALGFYDEAKEYADKWLELSFDDQWGYNYNILWGDIINRRHEEAYRTGLNTPVKNLCMDYMAMNLLFMGRYREALYYYRKYVDEKEKKGVHIPELHLFLGYSLLRSGYQEEARKYFDSAENYAKKVLSEFPERERPIPHYSIMDGFHENPYFILTSVSAVRDRKEAALKYLSLLLKNWPAIDLQVITMLKYFPMWDNIRNEEEFRKFLAVSEKHFLAERAKAEILLKKEGIIH